MKNIIYCYISLLFFLLACGSQANLEEASTTSIVSNQVTLNETQQINSGITLGKLEQRVLSQRLKVNGKVELPPQSVVSVSVPLGGYLKSTKLIPGMAVRKGEVLGRLEDVQYISLQEDYLNMKEKLRYTEKEFFRQKVLNESKANSDKVFEQTEMLYHSQKIALKSLAEKLSLLNIDPNTLSEKGLSRGVTLYSPIDGYVSEVNVNRGKYVNPDDVLFELIDLNDLHLAIKVFEKDIDKIFLGQKILAYTNAQPNKTYEVEVRLMGKDIGADGSIEVYCHLINPDRNLFPGMYMNGEVEVRGAQVYSLPEEAVVSYEGKNHIFITKSSSEFEIRTIETGSKENKFIEVMGAETLLNEDIVVKGAYAVLMKMKNVSDD